MIQSIGIFGSGRQGVAVAYDLTRHLSSVELVLFDIDPVTAQAGADRVRALEPEANISGRSLDASRADALNAACQQVDVVVGALPYRFHPELAKAARESHCHYFDLGMDTPDALAAIQAASDGLACIPDCGLAPGLVNLLGRRAFEESESPESVRLYCGVLPNQRDLPFGYRLAFSLDGLIGEYEDPIFELIDGVVTERQPLDPVVSIAFEEEGEFEAFPTSGGAGTSAELYVGKLRNYEYKTIRYPGHAAGMKALRDLGFWSESVLHVDGAKVAPRSVFSRLAELNWNPPGILQVCYLRAECESSNGKIVRIDLVHRQREDDPFTSMEALTSYGLTIPVIALVNGEVPPRSGRVEELLAGFDLNSALVQRQVQPRRSEINLG